MAARRWLPFALCIAIGCGGKDDAATSGSGSGSGSAPTTSGVDVVKQCLQLAKLCGDKAKHVDKIAEECGTAAKKHAAKGCTDKATAAYDCYQTELCGKAEKVWALPDLGVLAERHNKCVAQRNALRTCVGE